MSIKQTASFWERVWVHWWHNDKGRHGLQRQRQLHTVLTERRSAPVPIGEERASLLNHRRCCLAFQHVVHAAADGCCDSSSLPEGCSRRSACRSS